MGGPDSPRNANWPPPQIRSKPQVAGQYVRPPNVPPILGLGTTARALTAFPLSRHVPANDATGATMVPRDLTGTSCDLLASLEEALGHFRNNVEGSLTQLHKDMEFLLSPQNGKRPGKTLAEKATLGTSNKEHLEDEEEGKEQQDAEQAFHVDKELTSPMQCRSTSDLHVETIKGQTSLERLKETLASKRATLYQQNKVDRCVLDLISERPSYAVIKELSNFRFNASPLFAWDSYWRTFATSKEYSILRGIAVLVDTALVITETSLSTAAVASRKVVPRLEVFWYLSLMLCAFFMFDMVFALALEFPRFDLFVGRTGQRSLNLFAILQQSLVIIGMFSFPEGRFTNSFRITVHRFSFLRVVRALITLPGMGGKRLQRSIGELYVMIRALAGTLQPLVWCTSMCAFILTVFGTFLSESTAVRISNHGQPTEVFPEGSPQALLLADWGGTRRCVYSLVLTMLGGADWGDLLGTLIGFGNATDSVICFFVFICFTFIALLNTVTAVFIQCAFMRLEKDRVFAVQREIQGKREYLLAVKEAFENMCGDGDGKIQQKDMVSHLQDPEARAAFQRLHLDTDHVDKLFMLMDTDNSDGLTLQEFMTGCLRLRGAASSVHLEFLHQDFKFAIHTLADMMLILRSQTEILTTPRSDQPSSMKQAQQLGIVQRGLRLLSDQIRELNITLQEGLTPRCQSESYLDPELKSEPTFSF